MPWLPNVQRNEARLPFCRPSVLCRLFDPVVRGIQSALAPHPAYPFTCADDVGVATRDLRLSLHFPV
eukprot:7789835-Pyramimonas_sp.AAC.1